MDFTSHVKSTRSIGEKQTRLLDVSYMFGIISLRDKLQNLKLYTTSLKETINETNQEKIK